MFYWFLKWVALGPWLQAGLPAPGLRRRERPRRGPGDPRQQPPLLRRLAVHAAHPAAAGDLRGQGGVLHRPRRQGLVAEDLLLRVRPGADRPLGRRRRGGRAALGQAGARRGRPVRHLPRGHPLPRRPALPRQDRRRAARARDRRPRDPGRRRRHRRGRPARQEVRHASPARWCASASPWTSPATRAWRTTATSCARSPTRSCTRSCGSPARSTSTCTPAAAKEESKRLEKEAADAVRRGRAEEGVLTAAPGGGHVARGSGPAAVAVESRLFRALAVLRGPSCCSTRWRSTSTGPTTTSTRAAGVACVVRDGGVDRRRVWAYAAPARRTRRGCSCPTWPSRSRWSWSRRWWRGRTCSATHPRLLGDGRPARLGAALALGGRPGRAARASPPPTWRCAAHLTQANYGNVFLLMVGGPVVGFMCASLQQMADERDVAERAAAAAAERARLARAVHDGVLQVLALVQRRGAELGGEAAELGRLAGEQEARAAHAHPAPGRRHRPRRSARARRRPGRGRSTRLEAGRRVSVAAPGGARAAAGGRGRRAGGGGRGLPGQRAPATSGRDAPAWVLLEALPGPVELSVRDEGPGIPEGRLAEAEREGRLGVGESIRGRIADLGGTATLSTGSVRAPSGS